MSFTPNTVPTKVTMDLPEFIERLDMLLEQRAKFALEHYGIQGNITLLLPGHIDAPKAAAVQTLASDYFNAVHYRTHIEQHYTQVGWACCKIVESGENGESPGLVALRLCKENSTDCCKDTTHAIP